MSNLKRRQCDEPIDLQSGARQCDEPIDLQSGARQCDEPIDLRRIIRFRQPASAGAASNAGPPQSGAARLRVEDE